MREVLYGNSYSERNLDYYKKFYLMFPNIQIVNSCVHNLEWTHVRMQCEIARTRAKSYLDALAPYFVCFKSSKLRVVLEKHLKTILHLSPYLRIIFVEGEHSCVGTEPVIA